MPAPSLSSTSTHVVTSRSNHVAPIFGPVGPVPFRIEVFRVSDTSTSDVTQVRSSFRYLATPALIRTCYILVEGASIFTRLRTYFHVFLDRSPQLASSLMTRTVGLMDEFWSARSPGPDSELADRTGTTPTRDLLVRTTGTIHPSRMLGQSSLTDGGTTAANAILVLTPCVSTLDASRTRVMLMLCELRYLHRQ